MLDGYLSNSSFLMWNQNLIELKGKQNKKKKKPEHKGSLQKQDRNYKDKLQHRE